MENVFTDTALSIGSLQETDPIDLYLAFADAFGTYRPKVSLTADQFYRKFHDHYHTDNDLSRVLRFRDRIAGFSLCSSYRDESRNQAWISAFGIRPEFRGRGWAAVLMENLLEGMKRGGIGECSLEVHASNDRAMALFTSHGFAINRRIGNFRGFPPVKPCAHKTKIQVYHGLKWPFSDEDLNLTAVFQETLYFLRREGKMHLTLMAMQDSDPVGCLIMDDDTGRVRRLFVTPRHRRAGIGSCLMQKASELKGELRILNVPLDDSLSIFLGETGFKLVFEQYEMVNPLKQ